MKLARRRFLGLAGSALVLPAIGRAAAAETYPSRPVRFVVGYPPGGSTDLLARILGRWLEKRLGQPVIIENRPGASTNIATQAVVNAPPDGHTLLLALASNAINATLFEKLPFNFLRDISPVAGFAELQLVLEVAPSVPARNVAEFIALAKANPAKINTASFGTGTISHLAIELLKVMAGIDLVHVPYRGGPAMVTDMIAGEVQAGIDAMPNSLPHIQRGSLRALGITNAGRSPALPDLPTIRETLPGYEVNSWSGIGVPKGTPADIIARLNREINAGLADPEVLMRLADVGAVATIMSPSEFGAVIAQDTERWARVIKQAGIAPE